MEDGLFGDMKTGMKSIREAEEYVIHPNQIKNLKLGQTLLYCLLPTTKPTPLLD